MAEGSYRLGDLREVLTLQRKTASDDSVGGRSNVWTNVALVWAKVESLRAEERVATAGLTSINAFRVVTRSRADVAPAEMRFLRPVQPLSVTSITRSGTTATVTLSAAHYMKSGATVRIEGAGESAYNTIAEITVPDAAPTTFTYEVSGSPTSPATGTITATQVEVLEIAGAPRVTADRQFMRIECKERAA